MNSEPALSYREAMHELEEILKQVESDEVALDDLIIKAERAKHLIAYCREKLRSTQERLDLDPIQSDNSDST